MTSNDDDSHVSEDESKPGTSGTQKIEISNVDFDFSNIKVEKGELPSPLISSFDEMPLPQNHEILIDYDPYGIQEWIAKFNSWTPDCRFEAIDNLVKNCTLPELKTAMDTIAPILEKNSLKNLPEGILLNIFKRLEAADIFNVMKTCVYWRDIVESKSMWFNKAMSTNVLMLHNPLYCRSFDFDIWKKLYLQISIATQPPEMYTNSNFSNQLRLIRCPITCIYLDSYILITGLIDGHTKVWNAFSGNCIATFCCHSRAITALDMDNELIAMGSKDMSISVSNILTKNNIIKLIGHDSVVTCVKILNERVVSGSADGVIFYWSIHKRTAQKLIYVFKYPCQYITLHGSWVLATDIKGELRMWDCDTGVNLAKINLKHTGVNCLEIDESNIAIGFYSGRIDIYNWRMRTHFNLYPMSSQMACPVVKLKLNGNILYSLHERTYLKCWDINTRNIIRVIPQDLVDTLVAGLFLKPNGVLIMFFDGEIKTWNLQSNNAVTILGNMVPFEINKCILELGEFALGPNYSKNLVMIYHNSDAGIDTLEKIVISPFNHD